MYANAPACDKPTDIEAELSRSPASNPARLEGIARGEIRQHIGSLANFAQRAAPSKAAPGIDGWLQ